MDYVFYSVNIAPTFVHHYSWLIIDALTIKIQENQKTKKERSLTKK